MPIYTRTGDTGETGLFGGKRISKADPRVEAYGSLDELSSHLGLIAAMTDNTDNRILLTAVQKDLHKLMAYLAGTDIDTSFLEKSVSGFERVIDEKQKSLPPLNAFILPGGNVLAAQTHIARTVTRRAERALVRCNSTDSKAVMYLNRLSDLLFVLAREIGKGKEETL